MELGIEINKIYNYFDDGKIKESRRLSVLITEIIPFDKIDIDTLKLWESEVETCYWLYSKETDFFIKGILKITEKKNEEIYFVRTTDNNPGWFSLGHWAGRLDIDNSLLKSYTNQI
jgi:hypothetical protein